MRFIICLTWFAICYLTRAEEQCQFPFYYDNEKYEDCTSKNSHWVWCSLTTNYGGKWKYCEESDMAHGGHTLDTTSVHMGMRWGVYNNKGYLFHNSLMTHNEAEQICAVLGMKMVKVHGPLHNKWLKNVAFTIESGHWWIGATDRNFEGNFINPDGSSLSYTNWHRGQPDNYRQHEDCVIIGSWKSSLWNDVSCISKSRVICESVNSMYSMNLTTSVSTTNYGDKCSTYNNKGYLFHTQPKSFDQAVNYCAALGMKLTNVNNAPHNFFLSIVANNVSHGYWWIGASDKYKEGDWLNLDGSSLAYNNWYEGEPNNWQRNEDCAHIGFHNQEYWNDVPCYSKLKVICQSSSTNCQSSTYIIKKSNGEKCGRYNNKGYLFHNTPMTWDKANHYCEAVGMKLTKVYDNNHNSWLMHAAHSVMSGYWWIGASDKKTEGTFLYTDNSPVIYTNWVTNEGYTYGSYNRDCVMIGAYGKDYWYQYYCSTILRPICEAATADCETGKDVTAMKSRDICGRNGNESFLLHNVDMSHSLAEYYCSSIGMSLPVIQSDTQNKWMQDLAFSIQAGKWWIGANDKSVENVFRNPDGSLVSYTKWHENEPNNLNNEDCVHIGRYDNEDWNDISCDSKSRVICQASYSNNCQLSLPSTHTKANGDMCGTFNNKGYLFHSQAMMYNQAVNYCTNLGMTLTKVQNGQHNIWLKHIAFSISPGVWWLGVNDRSVENKFLNQDGSEVNYSNWHVGEPNNYSSEDCVHLGFFGSEKWNDISCRSYSKVICESQQPACSHHISGTSIMNNGDRCGSYSSKGYLFHDGLKNYEEAVQYCSARDMVLTKVHDEEHNEWLTDIALKIEKTGWWIGVNDKEEEGNFKNLDGSSPDYTNWMAHQPDDWETGEDCVHIGFHKTDNWNDLNCQIKLPFVCESSSVICQ